MNIEKHFYRGRVALNILANNLENAKECYFAAEEKVFVGVLSKNYLTVSEAVIDMEKYMHEIDGALSVGLGAGDPNQCYMVADIVRYIKAKHVNQVFTSVAETRAKLDNKTSLVNCLVKPSGIPGQVTVSTGPLSSLEQNGMIPVETAIAMIKDMGGSSIKFFPMEGLKTVEEYTAVAEACAKHDLYLEPTGGIDLENFETIIRIALEAGVKKIIPHVYSSIIDKATGNTRVEDVKFLLEVIKRVVDFYEK